MSEPTFEYHAGERPLLVSVPHDGRLLAPGMAARMCPQALGLPDTDWHVRRLYEHVRETGASLLVARYSRYVVDLNRPPDDEPLYPGQLATGLCPTRTFAGEPIYANGETVDDAERAARRELYWQPYHDRIESEIERMLDEHGVACLWDAHSIASRVPALFDGKLPVLNIGSHGGRSAGRAEREATVDAASASPETLIVDGRFRGGYITRHYGRPEYGVHALQLELAQRSYMDEETLRYDDGRARQLAAVIARMLDAFVATAMAGAGRPKAEAASRGIAREPQANDET